MTLRKWTWWVGGGLVVLLVFLLGFAWVYRRQRSGDIADGQMRAALNLSSSSFADGGNIPNRLTCDAAGLSPEIQWSSPPAGARSFVLVMDDPAFGFVHWLLYNIPRGARDIPEGASTQSARPQGAAEGVNDTDKIGYFGPCPPGKSPHRYVIRVYALNASLNLPSGKTKKELAAAVKGHVLAEGQLTGLYGRGSQ
jgi:Raf kinase inhibitor-like YbhB/YbcL family protein